MPDPLDEANDATADPFEIVIDAGTKAMLAGLAGDRDEEKRQLRRARAAYKRVRDAQILDLFEDVEREQHRSMRRNRQEQRDQMRSQSGQVGTNLGTLLKKAGVDKAGEEG